MEVENTEVMDVKKEKFVVSQKVGYTGNGVEIERRITSEVSNEGVETGIKFETQKNDHSVASRTVVHASSSEEPKEANGLQPTVYAFAEIVAMEASAKSQAASPPVRPETEESTAGRPKKVYPARQPTEPTMADLAAAAHTGASVNQYQSSGNNVSPRSQSHTAQHIDALLPKQTRVKIIGNNRTKCELIGRRGIVRGAQTLGGWHEVLLEHGGFVRVQRNALEVVSMPTMSTVPQMVAPMGTGFSDGSNAKGGKAVNVDSSRPHAAGGLVKRRKSQGSVSQTRVNIDKLDFSTLLRYRHVFNLKVSTDCAREELVFAVRRHFSKIKVDEKAVILDFVRRVTSNGQQSLPLAPKKRTSNHDRQATEMA